LWDAVEEAGQGYGTVSRIACKQFVAAIAACARETLNRTLFVDNEPPSADGRPEIDSEREAAPVLDDASRSAASADGRDTGGEAPVDARPVERALAVEWAAETMASHDGPADATRSNGKTPAAAPTVQPAASRRMSRRQRRRDKRRQRQALAAGRNGEALIQ
jgi:hypothetical protein